MNKEKFIKLFQETLEIEDQAVRTDAIFRDFEEWDSLAILSILAMINEEYDIVIPRKDFDKMISVEDVFNYINK